MKFQCLRLRYTSAKVVAIIVASLIPLILLTVIFITTNYYSARKRVTSANSQTVEYASVSIFNSLENVQIRLYQLLDTSEVGMVTMLSEPESYAERLYYAKQIQKQLLNISVSSDYVKEIFLVTDTGDIISSTDIAMGDRRKGCTVLWDALLEKGRYLVRDGTVYMLTRIDLDPDQRVTTMVTELDENSIVKVLSKPFDTENSSCQVIISESSYAWSIAADGSSQELWDFAKDMKTDWNGRDIRLNGKNYTVVSASDSLLDMTFTVLIAGNPYVEDLLFVVLIGLTVLLTGVILKIDRELIRRIVAEPVNTLVAALENTEQERYEAIPKTSGQDGDFQYITNRFNALIHKLQQGTITMYEEKMRTQEAELKHMQAQINPHFLYNSLFTISRLSKDGNCQLAGEFSNYLAKYFSYLTRSGSPFGALEDEMNHLEAYIKIMSFRFSNRIRTVIENEVKNTRLQIPKLIIQPLAENAFEHGLKDTLSDGELYIHLFMEGDILTVTVRDNGGNVTKERVEELREEVCAGEESDKCTGLYNVNKRLCLYYGEASGLLFEKNEWDGLTVTIRINLLERENIPGQRTSEKGDI